MAEADQKAAPDGEGEDDFRFALSRDEFVDLFLEDLELPDLAKRRVVNAEAMVYSRAGYSVSGSPANLALNRTVRNSMSRRIALRRRKPEELQALLDEIESLDPADGRPNASRSKKNTLARSAAPESSRSSTRSTSATAGSRRTPSPWPRP